jgi:hypothetical protein
VRSCILGFERTGRGLREAKCGLGKSGLLREDEVRTGDRAGDSHPLSIESHAHSRDGVRRVVRSICRTNFKMSPLLSMCPPHQSSDLQYSTVSTTRYHASCSADAYTHAPDCRLPVDVH